MPISRRRLLLGSSGLALALVGGRTLWRWWAGAPRPIARRAAPSGSGSTLCIGAAPSSTPVALRRRPPLHPDTLARFVDRLPVPRSLEPDGRRPDPTTPGESIPHYRVAMRAADIRVHRDLPPTSMWSYGGAVPGPVLETRSGRGFLVEWVNELPARHFLPIDHTLHGAGADRPEVRAVVHVHGAKAPPESDGHPEAWYPPGRSAVFHYPNRQDATMLWYHDHTMGIERLNQYAGLFGVLFVRDDLEDSLGLPSGECEVPLVLCDRLFDEDGQLHYPTSGDPDSPWVSEVFGDAHLVNGKLFPYLEVGPRPYRLRVLNASNSRAYDLSLSNDGTLRQIGTDQGLLPAPVSARSVTLAPGERADLIVDFGEAAGQNIVLRSQALELMQFRVASGPRDKQRPLPARLRPLTGPAPSEAIKTRTLTLNQYEDPRSHRMIMLLNGAYWHDAVTEKPELGTTEIWNLVNLTEDVHPIHLHLVRFRILERQAFDSDEFLTSGSMQRVGPAAAPLPNDAGWKDTVRVEPGMVTRILVHFDGYPGRYVWHCHVLEHAANEMMRPFEVVANSARRDAQ